jgi:hypothetical protein
MAEKSVGLEIRVNRSNKNHRWGEVYPSDFGFSDIHRISHEIMPRSRRPRSRRKSGLSVLHAWWYTRIMKIYMRNLHAGRMRNSQLCGD